MEQSILAGGSFFVTLFHFLWASLVTQLVKNSPAMQEAWVRSLGWEDPLEKERQPSPLFWPGEFHGLYGPWGHKESDTTEQLSLHFISVSLKKRKCIFSLCRIKS